MCNASTEGGQRCAHHAKIEYNEAVAAYQQTQDVLREARDRANASADPVAARKALSAERAACRDAAELVYQKEIGLASTPTGREEMLQTLSEAEERGDSIEVDRLKDVLERGERLREKNLATRGSVRAAIAHNEANRTVDGTVVDRQVLGESRRDAAYASAVAVGMTKARPLSYRDKEARDSAVLEARQARQAQARTQAAYDSTAEGQARLRSAESAARRSGDAYAAREAAARRAAADQYSQGAAAALPSGRPTQVIAAERESLRTDVDRARDAYEANPSPAAKQAYDDVAGHYRQVDQEYLRSLPRPNPSTDFTNPGLWQMADGGDTCDRTTAWRSVELAARDYDNAQVRSGQMTNTEFYSRAAKRAQARQSVLDSEGTGQLDPVDKRFAAAEARRRATRTPVGAASR